MLVALEETWVSKIIIKFSVLLFKKKTARGRTVLVYCTNSIKMSKSLKPITVADGFLMQDNLNKPSLHNDSNCSSL